MANEMVSARRSEDGSLSVITGHMRLRAQLQVNGRAEVVDVGTGQTLIVHEVGGKLLAVPPEGQKAIEKAADAVIRSVSGG